jgi:hypothetical protein
MSILGIGPPNAKIMIVGNCYSDEDTRACAPFQGAAGMELSRMLQDAGYCAGMLPDQRSELAAIWRSPRQHDRLPQGRCDFRSHHAQGKVCALPCSYRVQSAAAGDRAGGRTSSLPRHHPDLAADRSRIHHEVEGQSPPHVVGQDQPNSVTAPTQLPRSSQPTRRVGCSHNGSCALTHRGPQAGRSENRGGRIYQNLPDWNFTVRPTDSRKSACLLTWLLHQLDCAQGQRGEKVWVEVDLETRAGHIACLGLSWSRTSPSASRSCVWSSVRLLASDGRGLHPAHGPGHSPPP